ncbi:MAG: TolC family protein [Bacteroidota bacterium]|nr:TolC family protein [Bacteroidota bacterium]
MIPRISFIFILLLLGKFSNSQDTLNVLNSEQVLEIVRRFHPVVKQSDILISKSRADLLIARNPFDPIASHQALQKTFDGLNYYNFRSTEIKIPLWYGVEINAGIENLQGGRFDPSETNGLTNYMGVKIPLLKNLLMDKRRASLQQAKLYNGMAKVEQQAIVNNLLMDAIDAYWQWVKMYQMYIIISENVANNQKRFDLVKKAFRNGERAAIDTLEALTQLEGFMYQQNNTKVAFQNAALQLSAYLWTKDNEIYILPESVIPQKDWDNEPSMLNYNIILTDLLTLAEKSHPDLRMYDYKLGTLAIEKKLNFQELLPTLDVKYNQLGKGYQYNTNVLFPLLDNNFQYGLKIEMPLRLSLGRGAYQKTKLKIKETTLSQIQKWTAIKLKIQSFYNEYENLKKQIILQNNIYNNTLQLVRVEESRFFNGESSLFLINSRENKVLEVYEKLIETKTKYFKTMYALQWSSGLLK